MTPSVQLCRTHITGASGAGVTTLGRALAMRYGRPHHDADDYYWRPTNPPYTEKRPVADRLRLMEELFLGRPDWVLSGVLDSWGDPIFPLFDLVVFISTPTDVRLTRLRAREAYQFGADAVAPGGSRHAKLTEFIEWASHYEDGSREGRSRARHEAWLARLTCPVLRVDGTEPLDKLVAQVAAAWQRRS